MPAQRRLFLLPPSEIQKCRKRSASIIRKLRALPMEMVSTCRVCDRASPFVIASQDRYGNPVRTGLCMNCGLIYMIDRFTEQGYATFYESHYRDLIAAFKGSRHDMQALIDGQRRYADRLLASLDGYLDGGRIHQMLDIGGSTGVVAERFRDSYRTEVTIVDPAVEETRIADRLGIHAISGTIESMDTDARYDFITMCRTFEHLFDVKASFRKIRELLRDDGYFFCDIADYLETARIEGAAEVVSKIDHCFWLNLQVAPAFFSTLGFEIVWGRYGDFYPEVCFLLKKGMGLPVALDKGIVWECLRALQKIRSDWHVSPFQNTTMMQAVRHRAYNMKRKMLP